MSTPTPSPAPIVVGVDGSPASQQALRWAARQAALTSAPLHAVAAWHFPNMYGYAPPPSQLDLEGDARGVLAELVAETQGEFPDVTFEQRVGEGNPVTVLLHEAATAGLLVVGSRGHGAFTGMLLGSVSGHVVSHAPCPVVVVRPAP